jgi:hypothetical protein
MWEDDLNLSSEEFIKAKSAEILSQLDTLEALKRNDPHGYQSTLTGMTDHQKQASQTLITVGVETKAYHLARERLTAANVVWEHSKDKSKEERKAAKQGLDTSRGIETQAESRAIQAYKAAKPLCIYGQDLIVHSIGGVEGSESSDAGRTRTEERYRDTLDRLERLANESSFDRRARAARRLAGRSSGWAW